MNYQAAVDYMNSLNKLSYGHIYMVASLSGVATRKLLDAVHSMPHSKESDDCLSLVHGLMNSASKSLYIAVAKALAAYPEQQPEPAPKATSAESVEAEQEPMAEPTINTTSKGITMNTIKRAIFALAFVAVLFSHALTLLSGDYQTKLSAYVYDFGQAIGVNLLSHSIYTPLEKALDANTALAAANTKLAQDNSTLADIAANQQFEYDALNAEHTASLCTKAYNLLPYADKAVEQAKPIIADAVNTAKPVITDAINTAKPYTAKAVDVINDAYTTAIDYLTK